MLSGQRILASTASNAVLIIRILAGWVFLSEGMQKLLFPESLGAGRFSKIGIPLPSFSAPFVGVIDIVFGVLIIIGLLTRISTIPLLIDICVAIGTTKIPILMAKGIWAAAHESRTDVSMLLALVFLLIVGAGPWSMDAILLRIMAHPASFARE